MERITSMSGGGFTCAQAFVGRPILSDRFGFELFGEAMHVPDYDGCANANRLRTEVGWDMGFGTKPTAPHCRGGETSDYAGIVG